MNVELIKRMMDACYLAKRAREMLPELPEGVLPSYIQYLDRIQQLERSGSPVRVSDLSDAMNLPRPGVTRTVGEMESKGYLTKTPSPEDGRAAYLSLTEAGKALSRRYNADYFGQLAPYLDDIPEEDAECTIRTMQKFYQIMCERRTSREK